ncbi:unnamed protein product, partial [Candidula unifasciata]
DVNTTAYNIITYSPSPNHSATDLATSHNHANTIEVATNGEETVATLDENQAYYIWLYTRVYELYISSILFYLLPYTLIPILNMQLLVAIKRRREETSRISAKHSHRLHFPKPTDLEDGLTLIVLGITVCFFICCLIPAIYNVTQIAEVPSHTGLAYYLLTASDTMLCVNASTDFFFYCLLGRKFRNVFIRLFCPRCFIKRRRTNTSSYFKGSHKNSETFYYSV